MPQAVYSVTELNRAVQAAIRARFGADALVMVRGEIADCRISSTSWGSMVFFSLREGEESLSCVSFGNSLLRLLSRDTRTGEVFSPPRRIEEVLSDGRRVLCEGKLDTYTRRGRSLYQLSVHSVTDCGAGDRRAALEALRKKLSALGYFAEERKRPLPPNPSRIALVTAPTGAVIHDFLRTAEDRGLGARMRLYPVRVQGEGAGHEIAEAVRAAGRDGTSQVIVIIRGGGSEDDLFCFNDEELAQAIFTSPVPVVAGIGHEVDFCVADMTADVRASTPTRAAQLLWSPRSETAEGLLALEQRAALAVRQLTAACEERLAQAERLLRVLAPETRWRQMAESVRDLNARLASSAGRLLARQEAEIGMLADRSRTALWARSDQAGTVLRHTEELLQAAAARWAASQTLQTEACGRALRQACRTMLAESGHALENCALRLEAASPLAPLSRGYALIQDGTGHLLRSVREASPGQALRLQVADGAIGARVTEIEPGPAAGPEIS